MLIHNNPDIDYPALERAIAAASKKATTTGYPAEDTHGERAEPSKRSTNPAAVDSLAALHALNGEAFVHAAYQTFLGRVADPEGLKNYTDLLEAGTGKAAIAAILRYSEPGRARPQAFNLRRDWLLWKLSRVPVIGRLVAWFHTLLGIGELKRALLESRQRAYRDSHQLNRRMADLEHSSRCDLNDVEHELNQQRLNSVEQLEGNISDLQAALQLELNSLRSQLKQLRPATTAEPENTDSTLAADDDFYLRFETHFRGPASEIESRLSIYLPLLTERLSPGLRGLDMLDIGCGRGEWLNLLQREGYSGIGVDLDAANIKHCNERSLTVVQADALEWLRDAPSASLAAIFAFHLIEHLQLEQLNTLLVEALRVLAPGGALFLETPNPENLITASHHFYLDPTHKRPLPPQFSEFLVDYHGFSRVEVHRLHPAPEASQIDAVTATATRCNALFYGPQDYAVLASKPAASKPARG